MSQRMEFGFVNALIGREDKYPFLARCVDNMEPATNPKVEWQVGPPSPDMEYGLVWSNLCEIVQTPFLAGSSLDEALDTHLGQVETAVYEGAGSKANSHPRLATGAKVLLGRDPMLSDKVSLRVGRDLALYLNHVPYHGSPIMHRWISEVTVLVKPVTYVAVA